MIELLFFPIMVFLVAPIRLRSLNSFFNQIPINCPTIAPNGLRGCPVFTQMYNAPTYLYVNVKVLKAGSFLFGPNETTKVNVVTTTEKSVGMQKTGLPIAGLILAMLAVFGGFLVPKRK